MALELVIRAYVRVTRMRSVIGAEAVWLLERRFTQYEWYRG